MTCAREPHHDQGAQQQGDGGGGAFDRLEVQPWGYSKPRCCLVSWWVTSILKRIAYQAMNCSAVVLVSVKKNASCPQS